MSPLTGKTEVGLGLATRPQIPLPRTALFPAQVLFWLIVPLALASAFSVLLEWLFAGAPVTTLALRLNNSFGVGAQALLDSVRVWTGGDWVQGDSWTPMLRALQHLESDTASPLYQTLFFAEHTKFQYPPTSILPLELLGTIVTLTPATLNAVNSIVLLATAAVTALLAWTVFADGGSSPSQPLSTGTANVDSRTMALIAFGAFWLFYPVTRAFNLGQIQVWIDFAFAASCLLWCLNRRAAAGFLVGLASMIKPQLGLLILWALAWREWKFAGGFLAAAVPLGLVSLWRYGWSNHTDYLNVLSYISQHGEAFYRNNSVNGLVNRLLFNGSNLEWDANYFAPYNPYVHAATMIATAAFVLLPLSIPFVQRNRTANFFDFGAAALCFTIASPVAWEQHYGIMLPLFVGLLAFASRTASAPTRRSTFILLTLAWVLSAGFFGATNLLSATPLNFLQSYLFFAALILLFLLLRAASGAMSAQSLSALQPRVAP